MPHQAFLSELGRRLREARLRRALGVGAAAESAGVSRRYLTEAEAGRANPSVLGLGRLADALGTPLRELVDIPLRARERVALVGLRGAGKTTIGRALAHALEVPFVEVDRRVEDLAGLSLAEIFDVHGPAAFHRFEAEALEQVLSEGERVVLAAGGSIIDSEANFRRLRETCTTIWLRATPDDHWARVIEQGDRRPMQDRPRAQEELRAILESRAPLYATCDRTVETSGRAVDEVVDEVLELCRVG